MSLTEEPLAPEQVDAFREKGFLKIEGYYPRDEVVEVQEGIYRVIGLVIEKHGLPVRRSAFSPETFDDGFLELVGHDRKIGGEVYDAIKQLPAFYRLLSSRRNEAVMRQLRGSSLVGVAHGSYGIRIDIPDEERFNTLWHQDYLSHFRSIDGMVLWSPLVPVTADLGPVQLIAGSHKRGPLKVTPRDPDAAIGKRDYQLLVKNLIPVEAERLASELEVVAPQSQPGDLLLIDFLTLHQSGTNVGARARWSMQIRWFNYEHPTGIELGWRGGIASGVTVQDVHPELLVMSKT